MILYLAIAAYAVAMLAANFIVFNFGPATIPFNAFFLIGLDLTLRDWLHLRLRPLQMGGLVLATGALTYVLSPAAGMVAVASTTAFAAAALVDWAVFLRVRGSWARRANVSNVAGAAVDSLLFPAIAFGSLMPGIVLAMFAAKVAGGFAWAFVLSRRVHA